MKHFFSLIFSLLFITALFSQSESALKPDALIKKADSLLKQNDKRAIIFAKEVMDDYGQEDNHFIKSTIVFAIAYKNLGKYDSSLYYADMGLQRALKIKDTVNIIKLYSSIGVVHYLRADYTGAVNNFKKAVHFHESFEDKSENLTPLHFAKTLNNVASAYIKTGLSDSALTYFIRSLKVREENDAPKKMLIVSKLNIGSIFLAITDYENGKKWIDEALGCSTDINDSSLMEKCYINLGIICKKTGDTACAIENYKKSLILSENIGNERDQAIILQNLAILSQSRKRFNETYYYLNRALAINNKIKANNAGAHIGLSNLFLEEKKYDSAIYYSKTAIKLAEKSGDIPLQIEGYDVLYKSYKSKKLFPYALNAHEKYVKLRDSVITKENSEFIQKLKAEFETERKESEITFLKKLNESERIKSKVIQAKQNLIIVSILLSLILVIILTVFIVIKRKKDKDIYLVEKKLLETDLRNKDLKSKDLQKENIFKTKQLTTHALNMMQRNQMLTGIRVQLQGISKKVKDDYIMDFKAMIRDINQIQKTEKDWHLFKKYFESVNKDFNRNLDEINPNLSTNDYRLAALISLNLNIKETASVLNITPDSVKLARHRLRKKLNLNSGDDLYAFLSKL